MGLDQNTVIRLLLRDRVQLLSYIRAIVQDEHLAEDVLQDASILAVQKCAQIESAEHFPSWFRKAARYEALAALRRTKSSPVVLDGAVLDALDATWQEMEPTTTPSRLSALKQCLDGLSPYAQRLIRLRYSSGLSGDALAVAVERKLNTVYTALSRAHRALADCVGREISKKEQGRG